VLKKEHEKETKPSSHTETFLELLEEIRDLDSRLDKVLDPIPTIPDVPLVGVEILKGEDQPHEN